MLSFIVWYYYPIILAKFIKGKTLSKANIGLFNKIQLFTFGILLVVYIASIICINFTPSKKVINPSIDETLIVINDQINKNRAVLVAVDSNWNFNSLINKIILKKLERKGLTIAYINNYLPTKEGKYWIEKYNKSHSNLYILFSNRHQNGLILPKKLYEVNFNYSVKDFN
jgi:predicted transcriptional regulator